MRRHHCSRALPHLSLSLSSALIARSRSSTSVVGVAVEPFGDCILHDPGEIVRAMASAWHVSPSKARLAVAVAQTAGLGKEKGNRYGYSLLLASSF